MKLRCLTLITTMIIVSPAIAQEVGIKFHEMKIGTTLVTESYGTNPIRLSEKYIGKSGDFYVTEITRGKRGETLKFSSTSFYDSRGRLIRRDRTKGFEEYTPFSCHYTLGNCKHGYQYPNPFKDYKQTKNSSEYTNRLEGDQLIITWKMADDSIAEVPYKLGPYNLRVSSSYKNALGEQRGHKLIELIEPTNVSSTELAQSDSVQEVEVVSDCKAIYETLKAKAPGDVSICEPVVKEPKFTECKAPTNLTSERPASHIVLVLDASGSMAGKVGNETKMAVAKREASRFLSEIEKDVPIGLVAYGHRGNNTDAGKTESCAAVEWIQKVSIIPGRVKKSIKQLKPTGWTPLSGSLDFLKEELPKLRKKRGDETSIPVVYVISDGKETCGGDPVASARALNMSGVKAAVNIIGFDVDETTRAELEAISKAGGGKYFPAKDSKALRKQLDAARENEASLARYNYCVNLNIGAAQVVYHNARIDTVGCYHTESKKKRRDLIYKWIKEFKTPEEKACAAKVKSMAYSDYVEDGRWLTKTYNKLQAASETAMEEAREKWQLKSAE